MKYYNGPDLVYYTAPGVCYLILCDFICILYAVDLSRRETFQWNFHFIRCRLHILPKEQTNGALGAQTNKQIHTQKKTKKTQCWQCTLQIAMHCILFIRKKTAIFISNIFYRFRQIHRILKININKIKMGLIKTMTKTI